MEHVFNGKAAQGLFPENLRWVSPGHQAYQILHLAFTIAPLLAGLDILVDWEAPPSFVRQ